MPKPDRIWFVEGAQVMLEPDLHFTLDRGWYRAHKGLIGTIVALPRPDVRTVRWPDGSEDRLHIDNLVNA